MEIIGNDADM